MLILTRRVGETIIIQLPNGDQIEVAVLGTKGSQSRIGIEAPKRLTILREELIPNAIT